MAVTEAAPLSMHERLVVAAGEMTAEVGWGGVTMGKLASRVGVSRQTVYNELGSKPALAEAMVMHELGLFMLSVEEGFDTEPTDLVAAIRAAVRRVLELARTNALLQAIVTASYGAETELLPFLTTRSDVLVDTAKAVILARLGAYPVDLTGRRLDAVIDLIVRVVLSHVMHPGGPPEVIADDLAWAAAQVLEA